jgi:cyanate permease
MCSGWAAAMPFFLVTPLWRVVVLSQTGVRAARRGTPLTSIHLGHLISGMVLSVAGTVIVVLSHSVAHAVAGISCALFFIHFAGTAGWGYAQTIGQNAFVASLCALQNFASFAIASIGPALTGWLLDRTHSFTLSLEICSVVTILGALSYATLGQPKASSRQPEIAA